MLLTRRRAAPEDQCALFVNDVHSQLNPTRVASITRPAGTDEVCAALAESARAGRSVAIAGGRHSMGGQQFATDGALLDMSEMHRVLDLDTQRGLVDVEAGVQWPELITELHSRQRDHDDLWSIRQKQTGADRFSIGGALASNIHGRGLRMQPFAGDIEEFTLVTADGDVRTCSRTQNAELFSLAIGGYGLFGVVTRVRLRLARRQKLQRTVQLLDIDGLDRAFRERIGEGFVFGDFQFAIDPDSQDFLRRGVFSCYRPVPLDTPVPLNQRLLSDEAWRELLRLAHYDKTSAFTAYSEHYLTTEGQIYWSDLHQLTTYVDDYHRLIDADHRSECRGSEMITELYVPRERLSAFMQAAAADLRASRANCIYGTIRLIEQDRDTFLPWAREPWACVIFNLHVDHTPAAINRSADTFRALLDRAIEQGGSYYLTYHRHARKDQVLVCHPRFADFLGQKRRYDPRELLRSDWYAFYARMFAS